MVKLVSCIILVFILIGQSTGFAQKKDFYMRNLSSAMEILKGKTNENSVINVFNVDGTYYIQGHFEKPFESKPAQLNGIYKLDIYSNFLDYYGKAIFEGNDFVQKIKIEKDSVSFLDYGDDTPRISSDIGKHLTEACLLHPNLIFLLADRNRNSLGMSVDNIFNERILTFTDLVNRKIMVFLSNDNVPIRTEYLEYDKMFGDVLTKYEYSNLTESGHNVVVSKNGIKHFDLNIHNVSRSMKTTNQISDILFEVDTIAKNKYLLKFTETENKLLITTDDTSIYIFEAPAAVSKSVINWCKRKIIGKEIKMIIPSHHHPDHAGGIREYSLANIPVVVPDNMKPYYNQILEATHYLGDNRKINTPKFLPIKNFPYNLITTEEKIILYDVPGNGHSEDYIISWFPKDNILFVGDLTFFEVEEDEFYKSSRAKSVLNVIEKYRLDVKYIYTAWPIAGQRDFGTIENLRKISN